MSKITIKDLNKTYKQNVEAVKNINFDIEDKDFFVLLGPSGCGKSTTLRLLGGLEEVTSGKIYLDGQDITNIDPKDRDLAFVFQNYALYPHMSVRKNLSFSLKLKKTNTIEIENKITEVSKLLQINELLERKPAELSGGQRQRVALGRALVRSPKAFLLDEPLSNLDARLRALMRTELIRIQKMLNKTFIYVTHDQVEAMTMATKICIMNEGKILQIGTPNEIYESPKTLFVANFLANPVNNIYKTKISHQVDSLYIDIFDIKIIISNHFDSLDEVYIAIRPEHIYIEEKENSFKVTGKLEIVENLGHEKILCVRTIKSKQLFYLRVGSENRINVGENIDIHIDEKKLLFFHPNYEYLIER